MKVSAIILLHLFLLVSCTKNNNVDLEIEKQKILKLHHEQRDFHFNKNAEDFIAQHADNFISVNKGEITQPNKTELLSKFQNYFSSVEFIAWDDVSEPIIKISDDGTMAYTVIDKIVKYTYQDENDSTREEKTHFAWVAIYKKYEDEWKVDCVTSTTRP